jgi:hypothetical protein
MCIKLSGGVRCYQTYRHTIARAIQVTTSIAHSAAFAFLFASIVIVLSCRKGNYFGAREIKLKLWREMDNAREN